MKSTQIKSIVFGSSELDAAAGQPVESIDLDLKELTSGDQTLASITIESKDKNGPTFTTTSSDIGTDKGQDVRKLVADTTTDPNMKQTIAVQTELGTKFGPISPTVPPKGHSKVKTELVRIAEEVTFGRQTPAQGAAAFVTAAKAAIGQS